jgi:hypothetical protein
VAGQVLLKGVVPRDDIDEMAERCDVWAGLPDSELPPPLKSYDPDWENDPKTPRSVNNVEYASPAFARLALNPEIMRVVLALTGNAPQAHGMSLVRDDGQDGADIPLHGGWAGGNLSGANGLRNPANDYQASGGRILATFVNCATTLVNVPDGAGFVCVPGSHRSAFAMPEEIDIYTTAICRQHLPKRRRHCRVYRDALSRQSPVDRAELPAPDHFSALHDVVRELVAGSRPD